MPYSDIVSIDKKKVLFAPTGLEITTNDNKVQFGTLLKRDECYDNLCEAWRMFRAGNGDETDNSDQYTSNGQYPR